MARMGRSAAQGRLRQSECGECAKWFYPQELSGKQVEVKGRTPKLIEVIYKMCVCKECDAAMGRGEGVGG